MPIDEMTTEQLKKLDRETLEAELSNRVYAASLLIERLENAGMVYGNGHHAAQAVAKFAVDDLRKRWIPSAPSPTVDLQSSCS